MSQKPSSDPCCKSSGDREYELLPEEAQAELSVILNCSRFSLLVCCLFPLPLLLLTPPPAPPDVTPSFPKTDKGGGIRQYIRG
jgi:hypothetical protein